MIETGPLNHNNVAVQFCSDWLKREIQVILNERDQLAEQNRVMRVALEYYASDESGADNCGVALEALGKIPGGSTS